MAVVTAARGRSDVMAPGPALLYLFPGSLKTDVSYFLLRKQQKKQAMTEEV